MIKEGIININKPAGMTSHDCIYVMRRLTGIKRIGHTGTLDPNATGVLPICIGTAARITEYLDMDYKTYRCSMLLGIETDTQDIWGEPIFDNRQTLIETQKSTSEVTKGDFKANKRKITRSDIEKAFAGFDGVIDQYPPKYSAVRVAGRRLYEYARDGVEVEIKPRKIYIKELHIEEIDLENLKITFSVTCSKGTYIRTICREVGDSLGVGGTLCELTRTASGVFRIEDSIDLEYLRGLKNTKENAMKLLAEGDAETNPEIEIVQARLKNIENEVDSFVQNPDFVLENFGTAIIKTEERATWFVNGGHIRMNEVDFIKEPRYKTEEFPLEIREEYRKAYNIYSPAKEKFLGVAFYSDKYRSLVADKVFSR